MASTVGGKLQRLKLEQLLPDWENPRFLPGVSDGFGSDLDVFVYLDKKYNAFPVADSIARHGYFESEPLIALAETKKGDGYVVLEGNRRLTALMALAEPDVRKAMSQRRWAHLPEKYELPDDLPVLVVESRESVAPILGFRHVTGITPWDPYQQALYVSRMIDTEGLDAETVAELIGRGVSEVRAFYRNFSIVEQAEEEFEIADPKRIVDEFGVWTRAMTSSGIRDYIGGPPPRGVVEREFPLEPTEDENLARLMTWLFGVPRSDKDMSQGTKSREGRVIGDSRQLSRLGAALAHPDGRAALESGASLEDAERATFDARELFATALADAQAALDLALEHRPSRMTKAVRAELDALADSLTKLREEHGKATT